MDSRDLKIFLSVAEYGSVTLAAEAMGRSQSSVTRCIQDLESRLGFALLDRIGRRISLSAQGVAFEAEARRLIAILDDLPARILARASGMAIPMVVSATPALGTGLVPHAISRWDTTKRAREIHLIQGSPNRVAQDLRSGRAQIGLSSLPLDVPGVICERTFAAPLVVALPAAKASDYPADQPVKLTDIGDSNLVTMMDQTRIQGRISQALEAAGYRPRQIMRVNNSFAALQLVRLAGATAIVEPITACCLDLPGIILRPLAEPVLFHLGFFLAEGVSNSPATTHFFDFCEEALFALITTAVRTDPTAQTITGASQ